MIKRRRSPAGRELRRVKAALNDAQKAVAALATIVRKLDGGSAGTVKSERTIVLSPKRRAQLKLQGTYIGHLRHLKPRQKTRVKEVKAERGYGAAIALARKLSGN